MTADILVTIATGLAVIGYLEVRLGRLETRIDQLTERYIHHLEAHGGRQ